MEFDDSSCNTSKKSSRPIIRHEDCFLVGPKSCNMDF